MKKAPPPAWSRYISDNVCRAVKRVYSINRVKIYRELVLLKKNPKPNKKQEDAVGNQD
jgi:hypothetical protein